MKTNPLSHMPFERPKTVTSHKAVKDHANRKTISKPFKESDHVYLARDISETPAKKGMKAIVMDVYDHNPSDLTYCIGLYHNDWWGPVGHADIKKEQND